jgi:23S rRNA (pseudouridine1915-N3)-methyltransferase
MYKLKIYSVGKTKDTWLQEALEEYERRLKPVLGFEWILAKTEENLKQLLEKEANFICLDPQGKEFSSEEFSYFLIKELERCRSRLCFVIGGHAGIPLALKTRAGALISLSKLTFTHPITRLILVEQIYRSLEIDKGTAYHK